MTIRSLPSWSPALVAVVALSTAALLGCPDKGGASSGSASASASAEAPATASVTASAVPSSSADTATAVSASPSASEVAATSATPAASGSAGPPKCGTKPLPDCPLQAWMKANMNPAVSASDTAALGTALDKAATFAPAGYTNWASIAKDGAKAAKGGDLTAAKAACRTCHDQYKDKYKKSDLRGRKI